MHYFLTICLLFMLTLFITWNRSIEMFTVFDKDKFVRNVNEYYKFETNVVMLGVSDIHNSVATIAVRYDDRTYIEKVWFDEDLFVLDHARVSEILNNDILDIMTVARYTTLFENIRAKHENVVGVTRLTVDGSVTVVVFEQGKNKVYEITFDKDTLVIQSDTFLNIEYIPPEIKKTEEKPNYAYDIYDYFLLLKNIHMYFKKTNQVPHGTIRLTKDILTLIVLTPRTYASVVYDVHYDNKSMKIKHVVRADMTHALESSNSVHTLIKKSPLLM